MTNKNTIDRHHLLEIILWPNEDGSFTQISNSVARLKELGIYDDYKMTIPLTRSEHRKLHNLSMSESHRNKIREAMKGKRAGKKHPLYGKPCSYVTKRKISESMKGKSRGPMSEEHRKKLSEARKIYWENRRKTKEENHG